MISWPAAIRTRTLSWARITAPARAEILVPAAMIPVPVGVDHEADRIGIERRDRGEDLRSQRRILIVDEDVAVLAVGEADIAAPPNRTATPGASCSTRIWTSAGGVWAEAGGECHNGGGKGENGSDHFHKASPGAALFIAIWRDWTDPSMTAKVAASPAAGPNEAPLRNG